MVWGGWRLRGLVDLNLQVRAEVKAIDKLEEVARSMEVHWVRRAVGLVWPSIIPSPSRACGARPTISYFSPTVTLFQHHQYRQCLERYVQHHQEYHLPITPIIVTFIIGTMTYLFRLTSAFVQKHLVGMYEEDSSEGQHSVADGTKDDNP